jgi:hypothetical protein
MNLLYLRLGRWKAEQLPLASLGVLELVWFSGWTLLAYFMSLFPGQGHITGDSSPVHYRGSLTSTDSASSCLLSPQAKPWLCCLLGWALARVVGIVLVEM